MAIVSFTYRSRSKLENKQAKISDKSEQRRFGVVMTPFSS